MRSGQHARQTAPAGGGAGIPCVPTSDLGEERDIPALLGPRQEHWMRDREEAGDPKESERGRGHRNRSGRQEGCGRAAQFSWHHLGQPRAASRLPSSPFAWVRALPPPALRNSPKRRGWGKAIGGRGKTGRKEPVTAASRGGGGPLFQA